MKKDKKYGESFLTKVRFTTANGIKAEKSRFVWGQESEDKYTLSFLSILNGLLSFFRRVMVVEVNKDTKVIEKMYIRKKWWLDE